MSDPFVRSWSVSFGALQGGKAPKPFPFGTNATLHIKQPDLPGSLDFTIELSDGTKVPFRGLVKPGDPLQIEASGDVPDNDIAGRYRFRGYLNTDFVPRMMLVVGAFTWSQTGLPGDDPPDTGGWVGGATNPPER